MKNIKAAVILAAGKGSRISDTDNYVSKPLLKLYDMTLIERSIFNLNHKLNVKKFYIVTGYKHDAVHDFLEELKNKINVEINIVFANEWEKGNGASFLSISNIVKEDYVYLVMCDHLFNDSFFETIAEKKIKNNKCYLAISKTLSQFNELNDATKVKTKNGNISHIGKSIKAIDGFDTGFFVIASKTLEHTGSMSDEKNISLSRVMQKIADNDHLCCIVVPAQSWMDIDTKEDLEKAKDFLFDAANSKSNDGPVSRYLNRPISNRISKQIVNFPVKPNHISLVSFLLSLLAAIIMASAGHLFLVLGALLAQLSSILDGCDGEIARLKNISSKYGGWFDQTLDRYADFLLITGLTFHTYYLHQSIYVFLIGILAIGGSLILSYSAIVYDPASKNIQKFRMGRDVRIFIILIGSIANFPYVTLVFLAILMNIEVLRRLWVLRDKLDY
jgi:CDP-L-myo-inositol myo-inositolphosphotransferase